MTQQLHLEPSFDTRAGIGAVLLAEWCFSGTAVTRQVTTKHLRDMTSVSPRRSA